MEHRTLNLTLVVLAGGIGGWLLTTDRPRLSAADDASPPRIVKEDEPVGTSPAVELPTVVPSVRSSDARSSEVRALLQKLKPRANDETIDLWTDQFAQMSDNDIRFLVSQSTLMTSEEQLPDIRSQPVFQGFSSLFGGSPVSEAAAPEMAGVNLERISTVGYRQVLTVQVTDNGAPEHIRDFSVGPTIVTGNPLHIALRTAGRVFFELEDGRLTRNGSFERMADGHLGQIVNGSVTPLKSSPQIPNSVDEVKFYSIRDRQTLSAPRTAAFTLPVVRVPFSVELTTNDGVYFTANGLDRVPVQAEFTQGSLELSNTDILRNQQLIFSAMGGPRSPGSETSRGNAPAVPGRIRPDK